MAERPIDIWRRKLDYLRRAEAAASDPAQQFTIREQIKEARRRIAELESELPTDHPGRPPRSGEPPASKTPPAEQRDRPSDQFDVFLSHNGQDKPAVRDLADALGARGLRPWLDQWQLVPGRPWQDALEQIIETAKTAAVLFGPAGLGPWEEPEMRACLSEFVDRKLPVIPVLLPGAPAKPQLPLFLRAFTWVDLRGGITDEGLDLLQWGITGVNPNRRAPPIE